MKHIMKKTIEEATPQELLMALMHVKGIGVGPKLIQFSEPVCETLVDIDEDRAAIILVFKDDLEILKLLCEDMSPTDEELALYGKGESMTYDELKKAVAKGNPDA